MTTFICVQVAMNFLAAGVNLTNLSKSDNRKTTFISFVSNISIGIWGLCVLF